MLFLYIASAAICAQDNINASLLAMREPGKLFMVRVLPQQTTVATMDVRPEWMRKLGLVGPFSHEKCAGLKWDSSSLLPLYVPTDAEKVLAHSAKSMGKLFANPKLDAEQLIPSPGHTIHSPGQGIALSSVPSLSNAMLTAGSVGDVTMGNFTDTRMMLQFNAFVVFKTRDGRQEAFELKPSRAGGVVSGRPTRPPGPNYSRLPLSLAKVLKGRAFEPGLQQRVKVGELVARLAADGPLPLYADRRVEGDSVFIDLPENKAFSQYDVALGLAYALDMYWRKVGNSYFLASAPKDPREIARSHFYEKVEEDLKFVVAAMEHANMLPKGLTAADLLAEGRSLSEFDSTFLPSLQSEIVFASAVDRQRFNDVVQSSDYLEGTVELFATGAPYLISLQGHINAGGQSFTFEHP